MQFVPPEREIEIRPIETNAEREAAFEIRLKVFVEEQLVPVEEELDSYDVCATHFIVSLRHEACADRQIIGTARLADKGEGVGKIGRVAILEPYRGKGCGAALMRTIHRFALERGYKKMILEAQCIAIPFYEKLGYEAEGPVYLDANIEHRNMWMMLTSDAPEDLTLSASDKTNRSLQESA